MASPIGCNQNLWRSQGPFFPFLLYSLCFDGFGNFSLHWEYFPKPLFETLSQRYPEVTTFQNQTSNNLLPKEEKGKERGNSSKTYFSPSTTYYYQNWRSPNFFSPLHQPSRIGDAFLLEQGVQWPRDSRGFPDSCTRRRGFRGAGGIYCSGVALMRAVVNSVTME